MLRKRTGNDLEIGKKSAISKGAATAAAAPGKRREGKGREETVEGNLARWCVRRSAGEVDTMDGTLEDETERSTLGFKEWVVC